MVYLWLKKVMSRFPFRVTLFDILMLRRKDLSTKWLFIGFYCSPYVINREESWNVLQSLGQDRNFPWMVSGDFSEIMYAREKVRGVLRDERCMEAFREVLGDFHLFDLGYLGSWFTWEKGNFLKTNIRERLDRRVACASWIEFFPSTSVQHL